MPEPIVTLNEESLRADLRELIRKAVEEMPSGLLEEEAGDLVGAERHGRAADREAYRAGHYERKLATTSGEVTIRMPKPEGMRSATAIIERYRRRAARFYRNLLEKVPKTRRAKVAAMPEAIHAMESREASERKAAEVADELEFMKLEGAAKTVRGGCAETLTYTGFPAAHWRRIRTNNAIERPDREIRRRTRVVGMLPDGKGALMLVTARLEYVAGSEWGARRYLDVTLLDE